MLGERFSELQTELIAIWDGANQADDGSLRFGQEYLVSVIQL